MCFDSTRFERGDFVIDDNNDDEDGGVGRVQLGPQIIRVLVLTRSEFLNLCEHIFI